MFLGIGRNSNSGQYPFSDQAARMCGRGEAVKTIYRETSSPILYINNRSWGTGIKVSLINSDNVNIVSIDNVGTTLETENLIEIPIYNVKPEAATTTNLGSVKVGNGLNVASDGTISASDGSTVIRATEDLDEYITTGVYSIQSTKPLNSPNESLALDSSNYVTLRVTESNANKTVIQEYIACKNGITAVYMRRKYLTNWSKWAKLTISDADIDGTTAS